MRNENYRYNTAISEIADWQYTTYVRTHYNIKPHTADKMVQGLLKHTDLIDGVYFTLEDDSIIYGGGTDDTFLKNVNRSVNHMHLLIVLNSKSDILKMKKKINSRINEGGIIKTVPQIVTGERALREAIRNGLEVNQKALGEVQPIRSRKAITRYINKHMSNPQAHHNYFFNEN